MNRTLMRAVLETLIFLELSDEDVIDPDIAISRLELLASILRELTSPEREVFVQYAKELAMSEEQSGYTKRQEVLLSIEDYLGLSDEEDE